MFPMRFKDSIDTVLATSFLQVWCLCYPYLRAHYNNLKISNANLFMRMHRNGPFLVLLMIVIWILLNM